MEASLKEKKCRHKIGKKDLILVFGETGQVSHELKNIDGVININRDMVNLEDSNACSEIIRSYKPYAVINAAAYTAVDDAEKNKNLAIQINSNAPKAMANACCIINIPFIHISSDYVFDGSGHKPWKANSQTSPLNVYGLSKLMGEKAIIDSGAVYAIIRTSWVISSHGKNFIKTMMGLSKTHKEIKVINDQIGGPTPAVELAKVCTKIAKELIIDPSKKGIYHYSGFPEVSWYELAKEIFNETKSKITIKPVSTHEYKTPANRPLNSRLDCSKIHEVFGVMRPDWHKELKKIVSNYEKNYEKT